MRKTWILVLLSSLFILAGCGGGGGGGGDGDNNDSNNQSIAFFDVIDAKTLYISQGASSSSLSSFYGIQKSPGESKNKFYKINNLGKIELVKFLDKNHHEIFDSDNLLQPVYIEKVSDDYILVGFGSASNWADTAYLCRTSDGAIFKLPSEIGCPNKPDFDFKNAEIVRTSGNAIYYLYNHKIYKINLSGLNSLQASVVSLSTDYVYHFEVDKDGNLVYSGSLVSDTSTPICRVKKANGGIANISYMGGNWCFDGWLALDGYVYCIKHDSDYVIKKMMVDENNDFSEVEYGHLTDQPYNVIAEYIINLASSVIIVSTNHDPCKIFEVYNSTSAPRIVTLEGGLTFNTITAVGASNNYYYIAGVDSSDNTRFIKVNSENDAVTNILSMNEYDVYSFSVSSNDEVTFNALRMEDGKIIIGQISSSGVLSILDEISNTKVVYLARIR